MQNTDMAAFARMAKASREYARKAGLKKSDIGAMIREARNQGESSDTPKSLPNRHPGAGRGPGRK